MNNMKLRCQCVQSRSKLDFTQLTPWTFPVGNRTSATLPPLVWVGDSVTSCSMNNMKLRRQFATPGANKIFLSQLHPLSLVGNPKSSAISSPLCLGRRQQHKVQYEASVSNLGANRIFLKSQIPVGNPRTATLAPLAWTGKSGTRCSMKPSTWN